jgi:hypothetical protein
MNNRLYSLVEENIQLTQRRNELLKELAALGKEYLKSKRKNAQ